MTTIENILELGVGAIDSNPQYIQEQNMIQYVHNETMRLTNQRFTKELHQERPDFRKLEVKATQLMSGLSKIMSLLSRANKNLNAA